MILSEANPHYEFNLIKNVNKPSIIEIKLLPCIY